MGIKFKNVDRLSNLRKLYLPVHFNNTASYSLSAGYHQDVIVPFDCVLDHVWFANDADITASNGIDIGVCNATTDVVPLALAGNGHFWSASQAAEQLNMSGSIDYLAQSFYKITPSATDISGGCLLHITVSATIGASPIGVTLALTPDYGIK